MKPAALLCLAVLALAVPARAEIKDPVLKARIERLLARTPLIDGHNDLPWEIRERFNSRLSAIDLGADTAALPRPDPGAPPLMTDIPRLRLGHVGGQFWSVYVPAELDGPVAVTTTLEQMDLVRRMVAAYPDAFELAFTADDIVRAHKAGHIASLMGVEGGHSMAASLPMLRSLYVAGARYMTLTHFKNTAWGDAATDAPVHNGLTPFGKEVVREMNRLGMLIDLSHVSAKTMRDALEVSEAPVIFSHSGAMALNGSPRNVPDDVLLATAKNGGVVMVNFYPGYVSEALRQWNSASAAETARLKALYPGDPAAAKAQLEAWKAAHPAPHATLAQVADHIEYVRRVAGVDHVGLGSDFDGIEVAADGLDGVDKYPDLLAELARRGWSDEDLSKLAGANLLRVLRGAEATAKRLQALRGPSEATLEMDKPPTR